MGPSTLIVMLIVGESPAVFDTSNAWSFTACEPAAAELTVVLTLPPATDWAEAPSNHTSVRETLSP